MALTCPACAQPALAFRASIELAPDARSDEITVHVLDCAACGASALGVYEESRRGGVESDAWSHTVSAVDGRVASEVASLIAACPRPRSGGCDCAAHQRLGAQDDLGTWRRLANLGRGAVR